MFNETGEKIKLFSRVLVFLAPALTAVSVIAALMTGASPWMRLLAGAAATLSAWPLYGFGQLVQDVHDMRLGDGRINMRDEDLPRL